MVPTGSSFPNQSHLLISQGALILSFSQLRTGFQPHAKIQQNRRARTAQCDREKQYHPVDLWPPLSQFHDKTPWGLSDSHDLRSIIPPRPEKVKNSQTFMCFYLLNKNLQRGKWAMMKQNSKNKSGLPTKMLDSANTVEYGGIHLS